MQTNLFDSDRPMTMLGVAGRLTHRTTQPGGEGGTEWTRQRWISEARPIRGYGDGAFIRAELRFDDDCKNGHNTFAITGTVTTARREARGFDILAGGCVHDDIAANFPELAPLVRWHLTSSDGPMHYIANTLYHAGDADHNGLRAGERRQIINGRTKEPCFELVAVNAAPALISSTPTGDAYRGTETAPLFILNNRMDGAIALMPPPPKLEWRPLYRIGEGKARDLGAARSSAVWPEATDEQLSQPRDVLKAALEARHAALCEAFRADMERAGFIWEPRLYREPVTQA